MARDDPESLAAVSNFCVGRRGVGSVRWLEPTDVRSLDLDATVQLSKGSIEVYLDEGAKPEARAVVCCAELRCAAPCAGSAAALGAQTPGAPPRHCRGCAPRPHPTLHPTLHVRRWGGA